MKKEYRSPEAEKLALEDEDLERVSGGAGEDGGSAGNSDIVIGSDSMGNSDIEGRGRGGGCDEVPYHWNSARTHSSGRYSNCRRG